MNVILAKRSTTMQVPGVVRAHVVLLGTGTVGAAVLRRLGSWTGTAMGGRIKVVHVSNSRFVFRPSTDGTWDPLLAQSPLQMVERLRRLPELLSQHPVPIVIDATASDAIAEHHAQWLGQGVHVVTACKLGQGTSLSRWQAIRAGCSLGHTRYGDSATVGAGLPVLRAIRALQAGGDRIHAVAGVLSGSLAWLCNQYDGLRPFSGFVRSARDAGYTEPDPREDLSGEDVRRKLLILARAAGVDLESSDVAVASLVPDALASLAAKDVDAALTELDAPLRERYAAGYKDGGKLHFVARLEQAHSDLAHGGPRAQVGLESLPIGHPLAGGTGTDNRVAIWSDRYDTQPLLIQGPGAGANVTAAALLDDVLRIASG